MKMAESTIKSALAGAEVQREIIAHTDDKSDLRIMKKANEALLIEEVPQKVYCAFLDNIDLINAKLAV